MTVNLFYDCDQVIESDKKGSFSRQSIPFVDSNPIKRGIENLFSQDTLSRAVAYKPAFIDIKEAHSETVRGTSNYVPETWTINEDEKRNLCNWLCESGTAEDFKAFEVVFDMIEALFDVSGDSDGYSLQR